MDLPRIKIPVFVSCPSDLNPQQEASAKIIHRLLKKYKLEWRALGRNEYPDELPFREVLRSYFEISSLSLFDFELFEYINVEVRREWKGRRLVAEYLKDHHGNINIIHL
ncbi:hypothetical protein ACFL2E_12085 [Thermodesulfobacteriota bacterium]